MHVLTKIFVVLVSLLAVLLVPLVVVYAHNEDSFKSKYDTAQAQAAVLRAQLNTDKTLNAARESDLQAKLHELERTKEALLRQQVEVEATLRRLESSLAAEQNLKAETKADLSTLSVALNSAQQLIDGLVGEVRGLRTDSLALERQKAELDDALRDVSGQLEVAVQARRALQEELQRKKDELAEARSIIGEAIAQGFNQRQEVTAGKLDGIAPDRDLTAQVVNVRRSSDGVLAEIDAGSVDGVKEGWIMELGRGPMFTGKLRIITVDLNRSTGVVTLDDPLRGRQVEVGDDAVARVGDS